MDSNQNLIEDILRIANDQNYTGASGRRHWPRTVRERIEILLRNGMRVEELANQIPIPRATLYKWASRLGMPKKSRKSKINSGQFLPLLSKPSESQSRDKFKSRDVDSILTFRLDNDLGEVSGPVGLIAEMILLLRGKK